MKLPAVLIVCAGAGVVFIPEACIAKIENPFGDVVVGLLKSAGTPNGTG